MAMRDTSSKSHSPGEMPPEVRFGLTVFFSVMMMLALVGFASMIWHAAG